MYRYNRDANFFTFFLDSLTSVIGKIVGVKLTPSEKVYRCKMCDFVKFLQNVL